MSRIVTSNNISSDEKMEEIVKTVTKVTMSLGTAVGGGIVGQILIPIPFVGAIIGSALGGALGAVFSKAIDKMAAQEPILFSNLVEDIILSRNEDGHWMFSELDVNEQIRRRTRGVMARWHAITYTS